MSFRPKTYGNELVYIFQVLETLGFLHKSLQDESDAKYSQTPGRQEPTNYDEQILASVSALDVARKSASASDRRDHGGICRAEILAAL